MTRHTPPWLLRGLEAGGLAAVVSLTTVAAIRAQGSHPYPVSLPGGLAGSVVLAVPVVSLGVVAVVYPVAMAATRADAILGAMLGWAVGVDLLAIVTLGVGPRILLGSTGMSLSLGILSGLLAAPAALAGLLAAELFTPFGFGRRASRVAAVVAAVTAGLILAIGVPLIA